MIHLLGGYGADPAGELCVCAFMAGAPRARPMLAHLGAAATLDFARAWDVERDLGVVVSDLLRAYGVEEDVTGTLDRIREMQHCFTIDTTFWSS